ncbi:hypothetical protein DFA_07943 [Cavenderia fasciculata]|uniref:Translin n=1 Tax=Cavenderia fasciculata TaxID=261658 RepID=F4Q4A0_CACFS|nr:uncharacterized protein DFA_07943 [Cavenderia fasciculata]EGG16962.1 hypothetical protein DFA_07943 [Cavenderia fasciculata]|eukprot:XP_004355436.1 hypothetical protein DFA_07943 [Cavenderia fasciculata]
MDTSNDNRKGTAADATAMFSTIGAELEQEHQQRQSIKNITSNMDLAGRKISLIVQSAHSLDIKQANNLYSQVSEQVKTEFCKNIAELKALINPLDYYKYRDHWKSHMSHLVFNLTFTYWLSTRKLLKIDEVNTLIGAQQSGNRDISVELEDYLIGLCNLTNEMSRYCVNCVIRQDYETPMLINTFINDIYAGFRLLNLKNDAIRKRFDSMKYDIKRLEEVVYDLSVRKLTTPAATVTK